MSLLTRLFAALLALNLALAPALANDLGNGSWSETDSSNNSASPNGWASGSMLPSQVEIVARGMMGATKRFWDNIQPTVTSTGTANAQVLTYSVAPGSLYTGQCFNFIVGVGLTNTGGATLNVNALGAKTIKFGTITLAGGELGAGTPTLVCYDGTNFQLLASGARAVPPAISTASPSNPTTTVSNAAVMMGLGASCTVQPRKTGTVRFYVEFGAIVGAVNGGFTAQIRYGSGAAPANAAAAAGTAVGTAKTIVIPDQQLHPMSLSATVAGLVANTTYYFDVAVGNVSGAQTAGIQQVYCEAVES